MYDQFGEQPATLEEEWEYVDKKVRAIEAEIDQLTEKVLPLLDPKSADEDDDE